MISHSSLPRRLRCCSNSCSDPKPSDPLVMILYSQFGMEDENEPHPSQNTGAKPSKKFSLEACRAWTTGGPNGPAEFGRGTARVGPPFLRPGSNDLFVGARILPRAQAFAEGVLHPSVLAGMKSVNRTPST